MDSPARQRLLRSLHLADRLNATFASEVPVGPSLFDRGDIRIPDMIVVLDSDRRLIEEQMGYEIERHDKPPDFALEIASPTAGFIDYTAKRLDYARYGILEFRPWGLYHDAVLAGDRLGDGEYRPIAKWRCGMTGAYGDAARY